MKRIRIALTGWAVIFLGCLLAARVPAAEPVELRVMSFNMWHGGDAGGQPLERSAEVIRKSGADVAGLQETGGKAGADGVRPDRGAELARLLGWHYVDQGGRTGILSRYPVSRVSERKWGVEIELPVGRKVFVFNAHFAHAPYQPYQLLGIPYGDYPFLKTGAEAEAAAQEARGEQVASLLRDLEKFAEPGAVVFVTGDFNEPSPLDWTAAVKEAGGCPVEVVWPTAKALMDTGFMDTFRAAHPDPVRKPGLTWTPLTSPSDPKDRHDRIDFVLMRGAKVAGSWIVGESAKRADMVVAPYPSDHRAVVSAVELPAADKSEGGKER